MREDGPTGGLRAAIFRIAELWFQEARWSIPDDFLQRSHFERVVRTKLDWTSSPGYPYMLRATNNRLFFCCDEQGPSSEMLDVVWSIVSQKLSGNDGADHIRLFIKQEAHSEKKIREEKYRLISSVSVVDQIIDHMLFDEMNEAMIRGWFDMPSKPGWSPFGGGWRVMPTDGRWMATDASSWDWTVQPWMLEMVFEFRQRMCDNINSRWMEVASRRYQQLFGHPTFVTSGGMVLRQLFPGIMKSGCVNTIADNSMIQVLLHIRICLEMQVHVGWLYVMGDDKLQEMPENCGEYLSRLGEFCIVKEVLYKSEFAGFQFIRRGPQVWVEPVHRAKHSFNLLHSIPENFEAMAQSYAINYHRSKYRGWFEALFDRMGVRLYPSDFRDFIFDGM